MDRSLSPFHLAAALGLVALSGWLAFGAANALGAVYSLIAAALILSRGVQSEPAPALQTVRAPR